MDNFVPADADKGALFGYNNYCVYLLEESFLGEDDNPINYGVYLLTPDGERVCESTASSFPHAAAIAIGLAKATEQIVTLANSSPEGADFSDMVTH